MATVVTDIIPDPLTGATFYRVSRVFPNASSAARAVTLLEGVAAEGFAPVLSERTNVLNSATTVADDATPDAEIVAAAKLGSPGLCALFLDRLAEQEDDFGAPGEPPRCRANGSCD